jgi:hypothetical protein
MSRHYEMIREIFNSCSGNQMRDVHFEEVETEDPEAYVRAQFQEPGMLCAVEETSDGSLVFHLESHGLRQKVSFTEL